MNKLDLAEENLRKAVELKPGPDAYLAYSAILERMGRLEDAVANLKLFLETAKEGDTPRTRKARAALAEWEQADQRAMRTPAIALAVLFSAPGVASPSASADTVTRDGRLNVLLVTLDTTRADRVGGYGYAKAETPVLDSLARNGVRFVNAYCPTPLTLPSHCSILTGTYPLRHKVRNNGSYYLADEAVTLAERLKQNGYLTSAFVASFNTDSRFGLGQGFDVYDDRFGGDEMLKTFRSERPADKVADAFLSWLDSANPRARLFSWVHFFDPHAPYEPPPPYREKFADAPYDGEIAFMDHELGRIIDALRAKGILDRTLVVVAGDHGESLGEHGESNHGIFIYDSAMKVPLVLSAPGNLPRGLVVSSKVRLIDLMPTVLDALEMPVNSEVQGESLLPFVEGKKKEDLACYLESFYPTETFGWSELVGLVEGDRKFIRAPRSELYDLTNDPREEKDLASREARTASLLNRRLDEVIRAHVSNAEPGRRTLTGDEEDRLRSLGYVGAGAAPAVGKGPRPDPKDRIGESTILSRAKLLESEEKYGEAEKCYRELLGLRPDVPWHYIGLGALLVKAQRVAEGIDVLKEGLESNAGFGDPSREAGELLHEDRTLPRGLRIEPERPEAGPPEFRRDGHRGLVRGHARQLDGSRRLLPQGPGYRAGEQDGPDEIRLCSGGHGARRRGRPHG